MRAFVAPGARQEPGQQDRRDQPGEGGDLDRARRAAHGEIDRECGKGGQAAEQTRRHEGTMACSRQRVVTRGGMQQRIETIADDTQNCHGSRASAYSSRRRAGTPLLIVGSPCQSDLKRTLRRCGVPPDTVSSRGFLDDLTTSSARMVNAGFHRDPHGFEMVDGRAGRITGVGVNRNLRDPRFRRFLRKFSAN
ncbi:hypothetical protein ACVW1A_005457 [Bradyrhizobium sp. LB1.3]